MEKPMKYTVAVVLTDSARHGEFLAVKRPENENDEFKGVWGLPAITLHAGELPEDGAKRVCREKLGCRAIPTRFIGAMVQERAEYDITLMDIEMLLLAGEQPDVRRASSADTVYTHQQWSDDPALLMPAALGGSCCSSIFLTDRGLLARREWVGRLRR